MSSHSSNATKEPAQGAETSIWLAMLPAGIRGPQGTYLADAWNLKKIKSAHLFTEQVI